MAKFDDKGREIPDPTPVQVPLGFHKPEPLEKTIARMMRAANEEAMRQGAETFEEADDFDIPDDPLDPASPFEMEFDPLLDREVSHDMLQQYGRKIVQAADNEALRREELSNAEDEVRAAQRRRRSELASRKRNDSEGDVRPDGQGSEGDAVPDGSEDIS